MGTFLSHRRLADLASGAVRRPPSNNSNPRKFQAFVAQKTEAGEAKKRHFEAMLVDRLCTPPGERRKVHTSNHCNKPPSSSPPRHAHVEQIQTRPPGET